MYRQEIIQHLSELLFNGEQIVPCGRTVNYLIGLIGDQSDLSDDVFLDWAAHLESLIFEDREALCSS